MNWLSEGACESMVTVDLERALNVEEVDVREVEGDQE